MIFSRKRRKVPGLLQPLRELGQVTRQWPMQLASFSVIVGIAAGNDATAAGATTAGGEIKIAAPHTVGSQRVDVRRTGSRIPVASPIIPADIVGDKQDEIRTFAGMGRLQDDANQKENGMSHWVEPRGFLDRFSDLFGIFRVARAQTIRHGEYADRLDENGGKVKR